MNESGSSRRPHGDAPWLRAGVPRSFAHHVMTERNVEIVEQIRISRFYPPQVGLRLQALAESLRCLGTMPELPRSSYDYEHWAPHLHHGTSWGDAPFLWAESYFYRCLLEVLGYFADGHRVSIDPFADVKERLLRELDPAGGTSTTAIDPREELGRLLRACIAGNVGDSGHAISRRLMSANVDEPFGLLVDHSRVVSDLLVDDTVSDVVYVLDNCGREMLADLVLLGHLLATRPGLRLEVHAKPVPYYVSDATIPDVLRTVDWMLAGSGAVAESGRRVGESLRNGRLVLETDDAYARPELFRDVEHLARRYKSADLVVFKGDLNYRRLVGDFRLPPTTGFAESVAPLRANVTALRVLKSEVAVGLDEGVVSELGRKNPSWRVDGSNGVIQAAMLRA